MSEKALVAQIQNLLEAFRAVEKEFKGIRRVRDPLYWGKPYGTPITPGMTPMHGVVQIPIPGVPEIPDPIPTRSKRGTWTKQDQKESSLIGDGALPGVGEVYVNSHGDTVVFEEGVPGDEKTHQQALADIDWMYDHLPEEMTKTTVDVVFPANDYQFSDATTDTDRYRLRGTITFGYVVGNSHVIHMNPTLLKDEGIMWPIVRDTWRENTVPALQTMPIRRAVLMHESGHVVESMMTPLTGPMAPEGREREKGQRLYLRWLDAHSDYGRGNMIEAYAEMYAEWMLGDPSDHDSYAAAKEYAEFYGWGTPRAGVKALLADLDATMVELKRKVRDATPFPLPTRGEFRISDVSPGNSPQTKVRHVRDAAFWGAPVGTPLPLNKPSRVTFADSREWNDAYREYHDLPYLDKFTNDELTLTLDQYIADREPKRDPVPEEMQAKIEDVINGLVDAFPKILTVNDVESVRVTFGAGDEHQELAHAAGNPPRITVSTDLFVDPDALIKSLHDADHDMPGIILHSQAVRDGDADAVLRSVITHEFGHILDQAARRSPKAYREILDLADDTTAQWAPEDARSRYVGPRRWEVDPLIVDGVGLSGHWGGNFHSMYATENRHEWIAEAFADGYLNGDTASDAGKAVLAYFQKVFG